MKCEPLSYPNEQCSQNSALNAKDSIIHSLNNLGLLHQNGPSFHALAFMVQPILINIILVVFYVHHSIDTTDHPSVWTGPLSWRQLIWWRQNTLIAVGWDTMTQRDILCEIKILTENDNSRIVIRFELPFLFPLIFSGPLLFALD